MKIIKKIILSLLLLIFLIPSINYAYIFLSPKIKIWHPGETIIQYSNSEYEVFHNSKNSKYLNLEEIDSQKIKYLIGLEDQNFYNHHGVDYKRVTKSLIDNVSSQKIVSGGSTITQQLARILFLDNSKTITRKYKEYNYAKRLENSLTKNQILEAYINNVFFGKNIYGLEEASEYYYSKEAKYLNDSEIISLFAMLKSPNTFYPGSDKFKDNYLNSIYYLYDRNIIEIDKYYELYRNLPTPVINEKDDSSFYSIDVLNREAQNKNISSKLIGKTINTTINLSIQKKIKEIINQTKDISSKENLAVIVLEPSTGACLSLIGSSNNNDSFNRAIDGVTQLGSTAKPLLYLSALENGFTPLTSLKSAPTVFYIENVGEYAPQNATGKYANKNINMIEAISVSDNIYATKTNLLLGSNTISDKLKIIGINDVNDNVTNGLGSFSLSPLTITSIYNTIANRGIYHKPYFVKSIEENNKKIYTHKNDSGVRLFEKQKSIIMSYMLLSPYDKALTTYTTPTMINYVPNYRFAVKTGSTDSSSLVMGFNPNFTIGIYVGTDDNSQEYDKTLAKKLFVKIANMLMENKKDVFYETPNLKAFTLTNIETGEKSFTYYR